MAKNLGLASDITDPYDLLQVSPRARQEVVHAAYQALMKIHHPDRGGDNTLAVKINRAYQILSDTKSRANFDADRINLIGKLIGDHKILSEIAEGGFGRTYKAEDTTCGSLDCIKDCSNVPPEYSYILVEEFKAIRDLRHFGLPVMRRMMKLPDGRLALVMSYIPGKTLEQVIEKTGKLDSVHVAWITERIINILKYMHYHGVVHGDLKPQNIIIQPKNHTVVLVDFGLSMVKPKAGEANKGHTDDYAPPEQLAGRTLLPESDFYSLGMTMIYALGGGVNAVRKIEVPDNTPEALCAFIRKLIVRDILFRPNWQKEDLFETLKEVRVKSFGTEHSNMKPLPNMIDEDDPA